MSVNQYLTPTAKRNPLTLHSFPIDSKLIFEKQAIYKEWILISLCPIFLIKEKYSISLKFKFIL